MYSTIIELSSTPIAEEDRASHEEIPDWFRDGIADYTEDADDRELSLRSFAQALDGYADFNIEENSLTLKADAKKQFFQRAYRKYKETLEKLAQVPLEEFSGLAQTPSGADSLSHLMYSLRGTIEDRFGAYIYEDEELSTLDEWLRYASNGVSYYIGGVMAYHY